MRIAVSGTHASGKTTLIEAWLVLHPQYLFEPEPYATLQELGEYFADTPTVADFERQLEFQAEVMGRYGKGENVIFERAPVDFLAYMSVMGEGGDGWVESVREALSHLDVIVFLPLDENARIAVSADEGPELRDAVNDNLQRMLLDDALDLFADSAPVVLEVRGTVQQRLQALETATKRP